MKRWNNTTGQSDACPEVDAFLDEIVAVCEKHGLSISHEDGHGAFEIERMSEDNIQWLRQAHKAY